MGSQIECCARIEPFATLACISLVIQRNCCVVCKFLTLDFDIMSSRSPFRFQLIILLLAIFVELSLQCSSGGHHRRKRFLSEEECISECKIQNSEGAAHTADESALFVKCLQICYDEGNDVSVDGSSLS